MSAPICDMHNCGAPLKFVQSPGERPGVGRWTHTDPGLNYSAMTGRGHLARVSRNSEGLDEQGNALGNRFNRL